jgi:hypothetical protein
MVVYTNLIDEEEVLVKDGHIDCDGNPVIFFSCRKDED